MIVKAEEKDAPVVAALAAALGCCADNEQKTERYYKIYSFHNPF